MKKIIFSFVVVAAIAVSAVVVTSCGNAQAQGGSGNVRWKYKQINEDKRSKDGDIVTKLNQLGAEGWELVSTTPATGNGYLDYIVYTFNSTTTTQNHACR
jgi:hypothetical protein